MIGGVLSLVMALSAVADPAVADPAASGGPVQAVIVTGLDESAPEKAERFALGKRERSNGDKPPRVERELPLGVEPSDLAIELEVAPPKSGKPKLRVRRAVTTSIAVGDEGPHIDLVGFRDRTHPPLEAERVGQEGYGFRLPAITEAEREAKPYTKAELLAELGARDAKDWIERLERACCAEPYASPSRVVVFVEAQGADGRWTPVFELVLHVPMGC